jgi:hypothetical protein
MPPELITVLFTVVLILLLARRLFWIGRNIYWVFNPPRCADCAHKLTDHDPRRGCTHDCPCSRRYLI